MYNLMIVDDEKWIRHGLAQAIDWSPLKVTLVREAENGEQALRLAAEQRPDVVITDIRMSGMGGLSLCEELQTRYPGIQMILISGYREFSFAQKALRLGVADYLLKPIDETALLSAVKLCLARTPRLEVAPASTPNPEPATELHPAVRAVMQYVEQNYARKISLSTAAAHVHMNNSYLSKLFTDEMKENFTHYLARVRIDHAIEMLADPSMKIYQIAGNVGYPDAKYFVTTFKELTGYTPSEWRVRGEGQ